MASTCTPKYRDAVSKFYLYEPSTNAAIIACCLFAGTTILHTIQMIRTRAWFISVLVVGGYLEIGGYIARIFSSREEPGCWSVAAFVVQQILILIAPSLTSASIYMILEKIIQVTDGDSYSLVQRKRLTWIFVALDFAALNVQSTGGGLTKPNIVKIGQRIILVGLFLQMLAFFFFVAVIAVFHHRLAANPTPRSQQRNVRWRLYVWTLYFTSALILIRSIFRIVEYIPVKNDNPALKKEIYLYIFDAAMILAVMYTLNWFHPSEIGFLIHGREPISNGFKILTGKHDSYTVSCSSETELGILNRRH